MTKKKKRTIWKGNKMTRWKTIAIPAVILLVVCCGYVYAQTKQPSSPRGGEPAELDPRTEQIIDMMFREMDANHDGKISKDEWMAYYEKRFKRLDRNGDGFITKDEVRVEMREERERMGKTPQKQ